MDIFPNVRNWHQQSLVSPRHLVKIRGERADAPANFGLTSNMAGLQPFCAIHRGESLRAKPTKHEKRCKLHPGLRVSSLVLQSPSPRVASDLFSLGRSVSSQLVGLITGHDHLRKHIHKVSIFQDDSLCGLCGGQDETTEQ
ncbi:hypothetical protein J6590_034548 [Homalodisca vitripennis]|nr:hypothetical protein J6590_034548 [Homalodisca vitripennis]